LNPHVFVYQEKTYIIHFRLKKQKRIYFRLHETEITISAPVRTSVTYLINQLPVVIEKLIKINDKPKPIQGDGMYLFGTFYHVSSFESMSLPRDFLSLEKPSQDHILKRLLLEKVKERYAYYASVMKVNEPYRLSIRTMKTRLGTHAKRTKKITFSTQLVHYHVEQIDAVIVHELAHFYHFDHSSQFYACVLQYFPQYHEVHGKLKAHQFYA
jgi:predicted metal-dependent hydrolase